LRKSWGHKIPDTEWEMERGKKMRKGERKIYEGEEEIKIGTVAREKEVGGQRGGREKEGEKCRQKVRKIHKMGEEERKGYRKEKKEG
jgi:hypothetical protein